MLNCVCNRDTPPLNKMSGRRDLFKDGLNNCISFERFLSLAVGDCIVLCQ